MTRAVAASLALLLALAPALARADEPAPEAPPVRLKSPAQCRTEAGSEVTLQPGYHLSEPAWLKLDNEVRRLQEAETRLSAENKRLRELTSGYPGRTLMYVGVALFVGVAAGYGGYALSK